MKKPSLAAAMNALDTNPAIPAIKTTIMAEPSAQKPNLITVQLGRIGKRQVLGWFSAECKKQIKFMGAEQGKTEQALLAEALNDLFGKYGKAKLG